MDNRYLENVIEEMQPFFDEHGLKATENNGFANESKAVTVIYDESRQMYVLSVADVNEDSNIGEFREINSWLFDDSQNAKDAVAVGIDFKQSLRKELGIKYKRTADTNDVELPTATKSGNMTVTGFTKKMLDIFPPLKAEYKNYIAVYGNFLYLNFFGEYLVPSFKKLFLTGTAKQVKKFVDVLKDAYVKGDNETINVVIAVLCAASYKEPDVTARIKEALSEDKHFLTSYENFMPVFERNNKLRCALIK